MLAPQAMATYVRFLVRCCATQDFTPATASAPAGSRIERVSSKTSFSAAQWRPCRRVRSRRHISGEAKRLLADLLHRHAVGEQTHVRQLDPPAGLERARHRVRILGLHADHLDLGPHALHVRGDAAREPTAADGHEDRIERTLVLPQDLHADRALARDHIGVVVRMHEHRVRALLQRERVRVGVAVGVTEQHDFRTARLDRGDLDVGW
jgi:hypothetical protein